MTEWYMPHITASTINPGDESITLRDLIKQLNRPGALKLSNNYCYSLPSIRNVIFNPPATFVFWTDGTKTVVKCGERDAYDPEKGLAMAIAKKAMGNKGSYFAVFKKWVKYEEGGCGPDYCEIGE